MLVDIEVGLLDSDKMLVDMLTEIKKPFLIVLTKADKLKDQQVAKQLDSVATYIKSAGSLCNPNIHAVSS